jgi:hypothetical protein
VSKKGVMQLIHASLLPNYHANSRSNKILNRFFCKLNGVARPIVQQTMKVALFLTTNQKILVEKS